MSRPVSTVIDPDLCIGCGLCVEVCPSRTITMTAGRAVVTGSISMWCGHCAAICPVGAVRVAGLDAFALANIETSDACLPPGGYDAAGLVQLMRSRRSCRNYTAEPVSRSILEDLARIGTTAPSGTNSQLWRFTILTDRLQVETLGNTVAGYFKRLNRLARHGFVRRFLKLLGNDALDRYWRRYYESVAESLNDWERHGVDRLFHGAPAAILVGAGADASCPQEDAMLATQNILLAAHALGLGTCLIGFAVEAMRRDARIKAAAGIPAAEQVYAAIAVGYPAESYQRVTSRLQPFIRISD